jgi:hypothetical protein
MSLMFRSLAVVALLFCASPVFAQQVPDWTTTVKLGRPLFVTLFSGERVEGIAGTVAPEGISVATPAGVKTVHYGDMRRVEKRDGPWNGIWIGTAIGTGLGIAAALSDDGCQTDFGVRVCSDVSAGYVVAGSVYGALIGWGVDTLIKGRSTVFDNAGATKISFAASPQGVSARVSLRW